MDTAMFTPAIIALIFVALAFDFMNGMHDSANAIATVVSTRVLKPMQAVLWAGLFNFAAYFLFEAHVAKTVGSGIISPDLVDRRASRPSSGADFPKPSMPLCFRPSPDFSLPFC